MAEPRHTSGHSVADDYRQPSVAIPHAPGQTWVEERTRVAVGRNVNVSGKLIFTEPVRIEGFFKGEVSSTELVVIAESGRIEGNVKAPRLLVLGEMHGDIPGSLHVTLGPKARLHGRIITGSLTVCEGAYFEGDVTMKAAHVGEMSPSRAV